MSFLELRHDWYGKTEVEILKEVGARIRQYRKNMGLTQKELSEKTGKSIADISLLERGKNINLNSFLRILRALEVLENFDKSLNPPTSNPLLKSKYYKK